MILHMLILYVPALALMFSVRILNPTLACLLSAYLDAALLSIISKNFVNMSTHLHDHGSSQSRVECRKTKYVNLYTLQRLWIEMLILRPGHGSDICGVEGCLLAVISGT